MDTIGEIGGGLSDNSGLADIAMPRRIQVPSRGMDGRRGQKTNELMIPVDSNIMGGAFA